MLGIRGVIAVQISASRDEILIKIPRLVVRNQDNSQVEVLDANSKHFNSLNVHKNGSTIPSSRSVQCMSNA